VEPRRRTAAIQALAEIRTAEAVEVLQWVAAVDHDSATDAVAALGEIRSPAAIAALLSLLAEPAQRHAAGDALVRAGPGEIKEIALGLQRPEPSVRRAVVEILARMRHPSTSQVLEGALDDPSAAVRLAAVHGLAYLKPQGTTEKLRLLAATDEDPSVRRAAHSLLEP
jgi:HEAT repeat protein